MCGFAPIVVALSCPVGLIQIFLEIGVSWMLRFQGIAFGLGGRFGII